MQEVAKELIPIPLNFSEKFLEEKDNQGLPAHIKVIHFARWWLRLAGYIEPSKIRGIWELSEKGKEIIPELENMDNEQLDNFRKEVTRKGTETQKQRNKEKGHVSAEKQASNLQMDTDESRTEIDLEYKEKQQHLEQIKQMDPSKFERLCAQLLKKAGYEDVKVTSKAGDGGLDGFGFLSVGLIRFSVAFQAKRFKDVKIGPDPIQALYGARRQDHKEKAVFITTSSFTKKAQEAARQLSIDLIDGDKLIDLLRKYEIGCSKHYAFDQEFFDTL